MRRRKQATKRLRRKTTKIARRDAPTAVRGPSIAGLQDQLDVRTRERDEALEQQLASAEVLKVISSSTGKLEPVFQTILENSITICEAKFGAFWLSEGHSFRCVALHGTSPAFTELRRREPIFHPNPTLLSPLGRIARSKQLVHVADCRTEQAYIEGDPGFVALVDLAGARTILVVPILRDDELVGAVNIFRQEVHPFTDKQIELVKNFAAQAVIAIENARLLNELRQRTDDLSESLEQQTATSEVLKVISSSPGDLEPVFQAILANATRICDAKFGVLFRYENGMFRAAATQNAPQAFVEFHRELGSFKAPARSPLDRLLKAGGAIYSADEATNPGAPARLGGARSLVTVPMRKDGQLIGAIIIYRQEVRPFTDKQIELLTNFAAQAVIAIENARLLNELRQRTDDLTESLEQQTATSEVLRVISSSPGDLEPVFEAMLQNSVRICEAGFGQMFLCEGDNVRLVAAVGVPKALVEFDKERGSFQPSVGGGLDGVIRTKQVVRIVDLLSEHASYPPTRLGGARSYIAVPMLKEGKLVGAIAVYRQE